MKDNEYYGDTPTGIVALVALVYVAIILLGALALFHGLTAGTGC